MREKQKKILPKLYIEQQQQPEKSFFFQQKTKKKRQKMNKKISKSKKHLSIFLLKNFKLENLEPESERKTAPQATFKKQSKEKCFR